MFHRSCCLVTKSCLTLCDPMDFSMPGLPIPHYLMEFAQVQVYWIGNVIQPFHPLLSSSPSAFSLSQHQGFVFFFPVRLLFILGAQSIGASAPILPMNIQSWFPLRLTGLMSLLSKRLSRIFSSTTIQKHQFFSALPSLWSKFASAHDYWK